MWVPVCQELVGDNFIIDWDDKRALVILKEARSKHQMVFHLYTVHIALAIQLWILKLPILGQEWL